MIYEIEFYRWTDTPEQSEVIRRLSRSFPISTPRKNMA